MVSLYKRERGEFLQTLKGLATKYAVILDDSDLEYVLNKAVSELDKMMYNPRQVIFDGQCLTQKEGYTLVDVTNYKIDAICNVYYSPNISDNFISDASLGVGLMPWLSSLWGLSVVSDISGYLILQGNLNMINRRMANQDDYFLMPVDSDGRQLLQIRRNPELFILEFLPHLEPKAESWYMFEHEFQFVLEYARCEMFLRNAEIMMSAQPLGFGDKVDSQINYWKEKENSVVKEFKDSQIITYIS